MSQFKIPVDGRAPEPCTYVSGCLRVSALTERLLRVEYSKNGAFCDAPTQVVWNRSFSSPALHVIEGKQALTVSTDAVTWKLSRRGRVLSMHTADGRALSLKGNLMGTRRTLDFTFGAVKIGKGLLSQGGAALMDDSNSLLLDENSRIFARKVKQLDHYYFCYGNDYLGCLRDFYRLTCPPPAIPRWALGNWWSRYKAYTQQEYLDLMERFRQEGIPITVATVDMDWHWVDLQRFGELAKRPAALSRRMFWESGWTGYSWNTDLFPDWRGFLRKLHEMNLHVPLNLHPADGVRPFEDAYEDVAKAMGLDPAEGQQIPFDLTNEAFLSAYFKQLHHPLEEEGVDFWWIDWQQGSKFPTKEALPGLDPLWALNHYHYCDNARKGEGLILSRYAGPGSHRYPLGFSGDTAINWRVLQFQPYFTANAANAGYGWWSHDIGGHHYGRKDDELYLRWLQFGVFSPINRLHSTSNPFAGKEPWLSSAGVRRAANDMLRLRHRLIPYIYASQFSRGEDGQISCGGAPLCQPLYYAYPEQPEAYQYRNTYLFGSQLLAAPITEKADPISCRAGASLWLPPGRWTDIFTDQIYEGNRCYTVYRDPQYIPVFAKQGAILPLAPEPSDNKCDAPDMLCVDIWRGNGEFTLYEDEGETRFTVAEEGSALRFTISGCKARSFTLRFRDILDCEGFTVDDKQMAFTKEIILHGVTTTSLVIQNATVLRNRDTKEVITELISSFQLGINAKRSTYGKWVENLGAGKRIPGKRRLHGCIREVLELP